MNQRNVYELFPDPIFHYKLEDYKQINKELLNYILELQKNDKLGLEIIYKRYNFS